MNSPGLRERKKRKTRWAIQEHALRLIAEQGYEATTIDQIAAAAEISPSTFFRYFPSKEDLIVQDEYDDLIVDAMGALPADLRPVAALREVARMAFNQLAPEESEKLIARSKLVLTVPALRARALENFMATMGMMRGLLAARMDTEPDDFEVRVLAGAIVGALLASFEQWIESDGAGSLVDVLDRTLAAVERGFA